MNALRVLLGGLILALNLSGVQAAENKRYVLGSGISATEVRTVPSFLGVKLRGGGVLYVDQTGEESLKITADNNILPYLVTTMEDGILIVGPKPGFFIEPRSTVIYRVTAKALDFIGAHGSGSIDASGISAPRMKIALGGAGSLRVAGRASQQEIIMRGAWNVDASALQGHSCDLTVLGSGRADINASTSLKVEMKGSGQVYYAGNPKLVQDIVGSGVVREAGVNVGSVPVL